MLDAFATKNGVVFHGNRLRFGVGELGKLRPLRVLESSARTGSVALYRLHLIREIGLQQS
jgi:hypothetical protein